MKTSTKIILVIGGLLVLLLGAVGGAIALLLPADVEVTGTGGDPVPAPDQLADGEWLGFITPTWREGAVVLGIDTAEMLTGQAARDAAAAAGIIDESDVLPNDVFIRNEDTRVRSHELDTDATVAVLDGNQPWNQLLVPGETLAGLFDGTYEGPPVYGIATGAPILMNVTIAGGRVTSAAQVYLP